MAAITLVLASWLTLVVAAGLAGGMIRPGLQFSVAGWELTRLTDELIKRTIVAPFQGPAANADVERYFALQRRSAALRRTASTASLSPAQTSELNQINAQAERLRPRVELRVQQAVAHAAAAAGLTQAAGPFTAVRFVWPPPATGFAVPPHILLLSPRKRIALIDSQLLRPDLSSAQAEAVEQKAENATTSALVDQIGGLGTYPSIVDEDSDPLALLQDVAHEWTHEYLAFHPLGARYGQSGDMTLINETVANTVGRELGAIAYAGLGLPPSAATTPAAPSGRIDFDQTMHALRLEVDALLKAGRVDEAEQRMNQTQQLLQVNGYAIRRINQAYFAFYGSYGDTAAASNPLGNEIVSLRRVSASLAAFVRQVENIAQPSDVGRLLQAALSHGPA